MGLRFVVEALVAVAELEQAYANGSVRGGNFRQWYRVHELVGFLWTLPLIGTSSSQVRLHVAIPAVFPISNTQEITINIHTYELGGDWVLRTSLLPEYYFVYCMCNNRQTKLRCLRYRSLL